ncbi:hypothetical protein [Methylobacterium sp. UNC300MFChir4.1]|uniref:hypothetical protein n=1 Tax=Methylobacterium sp. UNC300MFChir4.1 TaxID=1502747 RepID=UPI001113EC2A|nr:hypothetical protein [Methylobacterium sp. UNC300MFChir4.1]
MDDLKIALNHRFDRSVIDPDDEHPSGSFLDHEGETTRDFDLDWIHRIDRRIEGGLEEQISMPAMPVSDRVSAYSAPEPGIARMERSNIG